MKFLLDTNMCIYLIKKKPPQVLERFNDYSVGEIGVSSIIVAELQYGVEKSQRSASNSRFGIGLIFACTLPIIGVFTTVHFWQNRA